MTPLRRLALCLAFGYLLVAPQPASAGGWWSYIDVDRSIVAPGQRVQVNASGLLKVAERGRQAGPFYVYLLRDLDYSVVERAMEVEAGTPRNWWSPGNAAAIQVAPVAVDVRDSGIGTATATFTVPELAPATYDVMLCDSGCTEPLAEVIPARGFTVVADPATAEMARRADRLEHRIRSQADQLAAAQQAADRARVAAQAAGTRVRRLDTKVASLAEESRDSPPWAYAGWLAAGALAAALALLVLRRRRRHAPSPIDEWHPSDEELHELVSDELRSPR